MSDLALWKLAVIVGATFLAFVSETVVGFGATLFAVAAAGFVVPVADLLPVIVPVNVALSSYIVVRHLSSVEWGYLLRRVLPPLLVGIPFGFAVFVLRGSVLLQVGFGAFVASLAIFELRVGMEQSTEGSRPRPPLPEAARAAILGVAGLVHGLYASGGPLVVYVAARDRLGKGQFRSTLAALWLGVNVAMVLGYWFAGKVSDSVVAVWPALLPALIGGIWVGEWIHGRVDQRRFERAVFVLLGAAGAGLAVLGIRSG